MYNIIAQRQGQTNPWDKNFDVNRKLLSLRLFVAKELPLNSDFIHIFSCFSTCIYSPGAGQTTLCGQNSDVNRKTLSLCPFVASFKKISLKSDFIHILPVFIQPRGRCRQRRILSLT